MFPVGTICTGQVEEPAVEKVEENASNICCGHRNNPWEGKQQMENRSESSWDRLSAQDFRYFHDFNGCCQECYLLEIVGLVPLGGLRGGQMAVCVGFG